MPYYSGGEDSLDEGISPMSLARRFLEEAASAAAAAAAAAGFNSTTDGNDDTTDEYLYGDSDPYNGSDSSKAKGPIPLDYSVLSVGVLTLGLILFVEGCRHLLDHAAHGQPFFKAVLEMCYSELATLGLVELFVFILIKYYDDLNKDKKEVFGDVHFALFYTTIFNAFQSCLTAFVTRRSSNRLWVNTEHLELDHYVEIREEYDRVVELINEHDSERGGKIGKWIRNMILFIRRPGLVSRFQDLRVQIRFHELRLHFLESNNLPLNLKVSDYLKRSELGVLIHLVHVSGLAWLLLTGGLTLLYFLLGMIGYTTGDVDAVGTTMTVTYFAIMFAFIIVTLVLYYKMRTIFGAVIKTQVIESSDRAEGAKNQRSLFWFESPHMVISIIQFMNFGYALALAVVIMYWPYFTGFVQRFWFLLAVFGCYSIFLWILSMVLPQYTLCTSLGYLVNEKELQSTVAIHRLEEAERQQRRKLIERAIQNDSVIVLAPVEQGKDLMPSGGDNNSAAGTQKTVASVIRSSSHNSLEAMASADQKTLVLADLIKADTKNLRNQLPQESRESLINREELVKRRASRKKSVSDGVASMRASFTPRGPLSFHDNAEHIKKDVEAMRRKRAERALQRRSSRKKAISQPGAIRGWQEITNDNTTTSLAGQAVDDAEAERREKSSSDNAVIQAWKDSHSVEAAETEMPNSKDDAKAGPSAIDVAIDDTRQPQRKKDRSARSSRRKTHSASAVIQSWRDFSVSDDRPSKVHEAITYSIDTSDQHAVTGESSDDGLEDYRITNEGKTIAVGRTQDDDHAHLETKLLSTLKNDLDLHPLMETEREQDVSVRDIDQNAEVGTKKVLDFAGEVIIENPESCRDNDAENPGRVPKIEDDEKSFASDKSIGNLSDVDVVQTVRGITPRFFENHYSQPRYRRAIKHVGADEIISDLKSYFQGPTYPIVSHVFGTLVVFFIIGHRVESMIAKTGIFFKASSSWGTNLMAAYWAEVAFLAFFLIAGFMVLILLPLSKCKSVADRSLLLSACMDIALTTMVLTLLMVAEAKRCCEDEPSSASLVTELQERGLEAIGLNYDFENECTCSAWGVRTYTGLGDIEPFTSLIVLRLFRFVTARFVVTAYDKCNPKKDSNGALSSVDTSEEHGSTPHALNSHEHGNDHGHGHGGHEQGTALELWERAIVEFPEIVEKHGQFSGELLQAMLGLTIIMPAGEDSFMSLSASSDNDKVDEKLTKEKHDKPNTWQSHIKLAAKEYSDLPAEAQGLIIAGQLGKPVKSMKNLQALDEGDDKLSTVTEAVGETKGETGIGLVEFEVDEEQMALEKTADYSFVAPFARLVRSMRRCDRRHLPFLEKWVSVDVVMTQFEIVYFEAVDQDLSRVDDESKQQKQACLHALNATKGGKGLRLCDVASGRKVVGHLDFSDVTEVHVEQDNLPLRSVPRRASTGYLEERELSDEYWTTGSRLGPTNGMKKLSRKLRWATTNEDRLKLTTSHGELFLRFYSDLAYADAEASSAPQSTVDGLNKDIAFQWAQTIVRICGRNNLRQMLPHYLEDNDEELRDYLQIVHFHHKEAEEEHKGERSTAAVRNLEQVLGEDSSPALPSKPQLQHARSFDEELLPITNASNRASCPSKPSLGRSLSIGTYIRQEHTDNLPQALPPLQGRPHVNENENEIIDPENHDITAGSIVRWRE